MSSPSATGATPDGSRARPAFERIALLLQGGGVLGAYQAGVYQALAEADLHPDWVAGISIGAINSALIAGNPPEKRVERLRALWETVTQPPLLPRGRDGEGGVVRPGCAAVLRSRHVRRQSPAGARGRVGQPLRHRPDTGPW